MQMDGHTADVYGSDNSVTCDMQAYGFPMVCCHIEIIFLLLSDSKLSTHPQSQAIFGLSSLHWVLIVVW